MVEGKGYRPCPLERGPTEESSSAAELPRHFLGLTPGGGGWGGGALNQGLVTLTPALSLKGEGVSGRTPGSVRPEDIPPLPRRGEGTSFVITCVNIIPSSMESSEDKHVYNTCFQIS